MAQYFKANVKFDAEKFKAKCLRLGADWNVAGEFILADQMRLLSIDVLKNSPPGPAIADRDKFARRINGECRRIFQGMNKEGTLELLQHIVAKGVKGKRLKSVLEMRLEGAKFNIRGEMGAMRNWHQAHRNDVGSIVHKPRKVGEVWRGRSGSGSFPIWDKMYVPVNALNRFIKMQAAKIGILAGGSIPAIEFFARLAKKAASTRDIPAWIAKAWRHAPKSGGGVNNWDPNNLKGTMTFSHQVPWNGMLSGVTTRALAKREADLANNIQRRMAGYIRRFNAA